MALGRPVSLTGSVNLMTYTSLAGKVVIQKSICLGTLLTVRATRLRCAYSRRHKIPVRAVCKIRVASLLTSSILPPLPTKNSRNQRRCSATTATMYETGPTRRAASTLITTPVLGRRIFRLLSLLLLRISPLTLRTLKPTQVTQAVFASTKTTPTAKLTHQVYGLSFPMWSTAMTGRILTQVAQANG